MWPKAWWCLEDGAKLGAAQAQTWGGDGEDTAVEVQPGRARSQAPAVTRPRTLSLTPRDNEDVFNTEVIRPNLL